MRTVHMPTFVESADSMAGNFPMKLDAFGIPQRQDHPVINVVRAVKWDLQDWRKALGPDEPYSANVPRYGRVDLQGWGVYMKWRFTPEADYRKARGLPEVVEGVNMPDSFL